MKKIYLILLAILTLGLQQTKADGGIGLTFNRTGTDAASVTINVVDKNGGYYG